MEKPNKSLSSTKLLIIAIVVGGLAAFLTVLYLKAKEAELREALTPKYEKREVIVASQALLKGTRLDASVLAVREMPTTYLHDEALQPGDFGAIEGKVLVQNVGKGDVILANFIDLGFPLDFSDTIPLKRRAMTIQVDEINGISGFIRPGNRIDLFVNLPSGSTGLENDKTDAVMPVLENVEVLATGESSAYDYEEKVRLLRGGYDTRINRNYTTLTINVTPREGAIIATARDKGDLIALLRNRKDTSGSRFERVLPSDLVDQAASLAEQANIREAAAAAQGFVVGADGVIRTKDGVALANQDLVVTEDGTIMTKDGVVLSGRGLTVNENGELVDANGNVIDPNALTVSADGSIIAADGTVLDGAKGLSLGNGKLEAAVKGAVVDGVVIEGAKRRPDGKLVMADGTVIDPENIIVGEDGTITTKDGKMILADGSVVDTNDVVVNEDGTLTTKDGKLILADGSTVDPDDVVVNADGSITTKDGKTIALASTMKAAPPTLETADGTVITGVTLNDDGMVVLDDGTVVDPADLVVSSDGRIFTKDGKAVEGSVGVATGKISVGEDGQLVAANGAVLSGAKLNEDGKLVLANGEVVDPDDVIIQADGTVMTKSGKVLEGLQADTTAVAGLAGGVRYDVDFIVGGVSKDGVANVNKVPVEGEK